eukprot:CAMPEP_0117422280 /NCGR_PEP_ID=MMETSP0758-20121206/3154_1 /TAXON_ID=63605 /ORGANISM="Percolomonas cosmopolitus, Strain AE-1 (ATCC 50343)" /LENGTH=342 /DNA_ID=CAMNT_0005204811 /DNA_START=474 /DNA_END=1499 /DNA_ORIENTATION=+
MYVEQKTRNDQVIAQYADPMQDLKDELSAETAKVVKLKSEYQQLEQNHIDLEQKYNNLKTSYEVKKNLDSTTLQNTLIAAELEIRDKEQLIVQYKSEMETLIRDFNSRYKLMSEKIAKLENEVDIKNNQIAVFMGDGEGSMNAKQNYITQLNYKIEQLQMQNDQLSASLKTAQRLAGSGGSGPGGNIVRWDPHRGEHIYSLSNNCKTATHLRSFEWSTVIGNVCLTSGTQTWKIVLDSMTDNILVGIIALSAAKEHERIGKHPYSWAVSTNSGNYFHNNKWIKQTVVHKIKKEVLIELDLTRDYLRFIVDGVDMGIAFEGGLRQVAKFNPLCPAVSMFHKDD